MLAIVGLGKMVAQRGFAASGLSSGGSQALLNRDRQGAEEAANRLALPSLTLGVQKGRGAIGNRRGPQRSEE